MALFVCAPPHPRGELWGHPNDKFRIINIIAFFFKNICQEVPCAQQKGESASISFTIGSWPQHVEKYFLYPIRYASPFSFFFYIQTPFSTEYQIGAEDPIRHRRVEGMFLAAGPFIEF